MSEIDWSKAPEGATHRSATAWFKRDEVGVYLFDAGMWRLLPWGKSQLDGFWQRPSPAWNGEGLPPVGTVCEYNLKAGPWFKCEIRYVLDNDQDPESDGWQAVIWCPHLEKEQMAKASGFNFRPIRTPEQIAADEREAAVMEMLKLDPFIPGRTLGELNKTEFCRKLHDAGYRKQADK